MDDVSLQHGAVDKRLRTLVALEGPVRAVGPLHVDAHLRVGQLLVANLAVERPLLEVDRVLVTLNVRRVLELLVAELALEGVRLDVHVVDVRHLLMTF